MAAGAPASRKARVARKHVSDDPGEPLHYVVLIVWRGFVVAEESNLRRVVDAIEMPGSITVIAAPDQ